MRNHPMVRYTAVVGLLLTTRSEAISATAIYAVTKAGSRERLRRQEHGADSP